MLDPFAMWPAFPASDYYESSAHPESIDRQRIFPPTNGRLAGKGAVGMVPTFTLEPFDGVGAQLCPCSLATAAPQIFTVASRSATSPDQGVPRRAKARPVRAATQP